MTGLRTALNQFLAGANHKQNHATITSQRAMAYIPGFDHDVFISYAHGDDREWINRLLDRLKLALKQRLGTEASIWIDKQALRSSRDFNKEIPTGVRSSAVFVLLTSPSYVRSEYCVSEECRAFRDTLPSRQARFNGADFANEQFAFRCPIVPVDNNEHWELFPGLSDIAFCNDADTFAAGSPEFETSFRKLAGELLQLLKRMRNRSHSVFVYPPHPGPTLQDAHNTLAGELNAQSYRLLPDRLVSLPEQLREATLSVFLLGDAYDETVDALTKAASMDGKPWLVWCSPASQDAVPEQLGLLRHLEQLDSLNKTFLNATITPSKLKEEVLALLRPATLATHSASEKPRVYLVYNLREREDKVNAGQIIYHFKNEFHFELADDPAQHTERLAGSDGVLLVWGNTEEEWSATEFESMIQVSRRARARGLCLFDPKEEKFPTVDLIRRGATDIHIVEEFGKFDPSRLDPFFDPIRRKSVAGAP
jgi:TIR domain